MAVQRSALTGHGLQEFSVALTFKQVIVGKKLVLTACLYSFGGDAINFPVLHFAAL